MIKSKTSDYHNQFYLNSFTGNGALVTPSGTVPASTVSWVSPEAITYTYNGTSYSGVMGNYWGSNYTGADSDGNGIGDTSFAVPNSLGNDTAPLMAPFGNYFGGGTLSTIAVSPATADLTVGGTQQFAATGKDALGTPMSGLSFTWASSNEAVGTIDGNGLFTTVGAGSTTVTVTNGSVSGTASVSVTDLVAPDLIPTAINAGSPTAGNATTVTVTVENAGKGNAGAFNVTLLANGTYSGKAAVPSLKSRYSRDVDIAWTPAMSGAVNLTAVVDAEGAIVESDRTNNVLSTTVFVATPDLPDITFQALIPNGGHVFAHEPNNITVNVKNIGTADVGAFNVRIATSDGFDGTIRIEGIVAGGGVSPNLPLIVDPTLRSIGENVTITAVIDPENATLDSDRSNNEITVTKTVIANGYKGKRWTEGSDLTTKRVFDLRGNLTYSFGDSAYNSGYEPWTIRKVNWTADDLLIPAGATPREARLCVPYCWDKDTVIPANFSLDFNGVPLAYEEFYTDRKGWGGFDLPYGMLAYNVTGQFAANTTNVATLHKTNATAQVSTAGLILAVVYEDPTEPERLIFLNEEFDNLLAQKDFFVSVEEATAFAPFTGATIDLDRVRNADLITFSPWAAGPEGNLIFNNQTWYTVWNHGGSGATGETDGTQVAIDRREVSAYLKSSGNEAAIQGGPNAAGETSNLCACNAFLVVEYADPAVPDLTVSTLMPNCGEVFSAAENTYTAKITNIGTADAGAFAVGFTVSGATGTVSVEGLAAGANTTVTWIDETIRNAGETVTITATADVEGAVSESNEENNVKSLEKTVVANGCRGKRMTGGEDITTAKTYDVRGDLVWSSGDSAYLSASKSPHWTTYYANWTSADLAVPANATISAARLYVPYTWDKGPVFPDNVTLTFNGAGVETAAHYEDEKMWGLTYPYGMTVYDVKDAFSTGGNAAVLTSTYPGGGNVSVRGMVLAVVYDDVASAPHHIILNEGFDLLYGGEDYSTTPEQATAYAPFGTVESGAVDARLITVAPGAGPTEGDLLFNDEEWTRVWNYTGSSQIGVDERNVTAFLGGENLAGLRSDGDWMEAAAAFLVVEYPRPPGTIAVTSTPAGAAILLDGADTGLVTPATIADVPAGRHVITLTLAAHANASTTVTVAEGETSTVDLTLTTHTGSLAVTSTPTGALILIDGADTGKETDSTLDGIAVGEHVVTLTRDGYRSAEANVTIRHNETAPLHLDLVAATGSITVTSTPEGAAIFLDGAATGQTTDATLENIPAGEHTVTVKKEGYMDASTTVTVVDRETVAVSFALAEPSGSVRVTSSPAGARILLDGVDTGELTNTTLTRLAPGEHVLTLSLDGYLDAAETVTVTAGETAEVHVALATAAITLHPGWNFVSTPKALAAGANTIAIFDDVDTADHSVLLYNGTNLWEAMGSEESFKPLDGVWIFANGTYTIPFTFAADTPDTPPTKDLDRGWNAIGFTDTVPEPAVTTLRSVENTWATLFAFDARAQEYDVSIIRGATGRHADDRLMNPFQGYWIYMNSPDTLAAIGA